MFPTFFLFLLCFYICSNLEQSQWAECWTFVIVCSAYRMVDFMLIDFERPHWNCLALKNWNEKPKNRSFLNLMLITMFNYVAFKKPKLFGMLNLKIMNLKLEYCKVSLQDDRTYIVQKKFSSDAFKPKHGFHLVHLHLVMLPFNVS